MWKTLKKICKFITALGAVSFIFVWIINFVSMMKNTSKFQAKWGFYGKYVKRPLDFSLALLAFIVLFPVNAGTALAVRLKLGKPIFFVQPRPGLNEKIFNLYKFRSMLDERDKNGELLSDEERLTDFGKKLRSTSLDELPELVNILKGEMSIVGPRPQLVRDMVFMSKEHRKRHCVRPGLTGLAQINGRNAIDWEKKLNYDVEYINNITFWNDMKIIMKTIQKALISREGITEDGEATATDYGDYLLKLEKIDQIIYDRKQKEAKELII